MGDTLVWIGGALVVAGAILTLLGAAGVLRFPDVYTRIHAASLTDTGGATLVLLGLALIGGLSPEGIKLAFIWAFIMLTTPAAANALANAANSSGYKPRIGTFEITRGLTREEAGESGPETIEDDEGGAP